MAQDFYKELFQLDAESKWQYLSHFYHAARRFYGFKEQAVTDEEVDACLGRMKTKPQSQVRKRFMLKDWKYRYDPDDAGVGTGFFEPGFDDTDWQEVALPHATRNIPGNAVRYGVDTNDVFNSGEGDTIWLGSSENWYRRTLDLGSEIHGEVVYIRFESVNLAADVWVNDAPVMINHLGLFPFEIEITDEVKAAGGTAVHLAVRVKNTVSNKPWLFYNGFQISYYNPPYSAGRLGEDWQDVTWSGIAGDVVVDVMNRNHLVDAFLVTEVLDSSRARMNCRVNLDNESWERFKGKVRLEISRWSPEEGEIFLQKSIEVELPPMNQTAFDIRFAVEEPELWSPEYPVLHLAHLILEDEQGKPIDDLYETFGIRTIKIEGSNYLLNNKKIYPMGTHDVTHYHQQPAICPAERWIVKDILLHKKMGANCSRFPSDMRMHDRRIAEFCDQLGYMLAWAGYFEVWKVHPEMEMYATRDLKAVVRSLRNAPSIIIWEMGDEPLLVIQDYRRYRWYKQVYEQVKAEDDTRPILPAGHFSAELLDLFEKRSAAGQKPEDIRRQILEDYPIYTLPLTYWDFHWTFMIFPLRPFRDMVNRIKTAFGGERLTILTEFGLDALPEKQKAQEIYGKFRWGANPYWNRDRTEDDRQFYGRNITQDDWRETQAAQAVALAGAITLIRESPCHFGGFYFMTMFDIWTYMQGVCDERGDAKLGYYVSRNLCQPLLLSGLHGSVVLKKGHPVNVTVSNLGGPLHNASLLVQVMDSRGNLVIEKRTGGLAVDGDINLTELAVLNLNGLENSLYQMECYLFDSLGVEAARTLELFYLED